MVATEVALEGIPVVAGREALVYSGMAQLVECLRSVTSSAELRKKLSAKSLAFCRQTFSTKMIIAGWEGAYLKAAALMAASS